MDFSLNTSVLLFDGGMGMLLAERGLKPGAAPYTMNTEAPQVVLAAHKEYVAAGADVVSSNTFTASDPADAAAGVRLAKQAGARFTAFSTGPTGRLIEPMGGMTFEEAYRHYAPLMAAAEDNGADLVIIETMSDLYECKAAILAAKEHTSLPVFCTVTVQENGRMLTGATLPVAAAALKSMGVTALGVNCSLGPAQLKPLLTELIQASGLPVIIQPNAGMPRLAPDGSAVYDVTPETFAEYAEGFLRAGAQIVGGCCGTTPAHIAEMRAMIDSFGKAATPAARSSKPPLAVSGTRSVTPGGEALVIGERLNPTGKKRLQAALRTGDMSVVRQEALAQQEAGCHILDINAGLPDIDEAAVLCAMVRTAQSVSNLPVQIDSSDPKAIEAALRIVNGKAIINSVSGKQESLEAILPLAGKYGASVVCLTLDENGIPETAEGRFAVAKKIRDAASEAGIPDSDLLIDCLTLTVAAQPEQAVETLKAVRMVKERLGLATVLGVSNISYGMPEREKLGSAFLLTALSAGLDAAILNPLSEPFSDALRCWRLLTGRGEEQSKTAVQDKPLQWYIEQYDAGTVFLPELLSAAKREIAELKANASGAVMDIPPILMASVQGDIHDIGKNIVITMLECHGFPVIDLGKDVPPETVIAAIGEHSARLVGLSALMTTTVKNMKDTVYAIKAAYPNCAVMIGGAAVNPSVSEAAFYGRDALEAIAIAKREAM